MAEKTVVTAQTLEQYALDFAKKLEGVAAQYGPEVWELAKGAVKLTGFYGIAEGVMCGVFALACYIIGRRTFPWVKRVQEESDGASWVLPICLGIAGVILGVVAVTKILHAPYYVAIVYPELAMAMKVLGL